jgi:23S rRNA (guanosine2251-2'-O)-methyltransferase
MASKHRRKARKIEIPGADRPKTERRRAFRGRGKNPGGLWLFGAHAVLAALENHDRPIHRLAVTAAAMERFGDTLTAALDERPEDIRTEKMEQRALEGLLPRDSVHQGLAALAGALPDVGIEDLAPESHNQSHRHVVVVMDQITDPHNIGAIMRSAAFFGAIGIVTADRHAPQETGTLAKAASGALESVPLVRVPNLARAMGRLKEMGYWAVALEADAASTLPDAARSGPIALVLGSEGSGLRRLTREACDATGMLGSTPDGGGIGSLNVSNAAAVALSQLFGPG